MDLKKIGVRYHSEEHDITLWMHPENSFGAVTITNEVINKLPDEIKDSQWVNTFVVANCFILAWEGSNEHPLIQFLEQKSLVQVLSNLELFAVISTTEIIILLSDAFVKTRRLSKQDEQDSKKKPQNTEADGD